MKIPIQKIFVFICFMVLICVASCATSDRSNSKSKNEQPLKSIQEVIGPPKERAKIIEQNKVIWEPQERFLDKKATQEKIKIWAIEPKQ
ncbi:MAG: hypothetical protein A2X59_10595 [Nitrospirae bacterium GWC2_42_7]|nr:MAG: hypothetical protein A2X59_10595 [Nitrospirae bacterium GWC2_42_7]